MSLDLTSLATTSESSMRKRFALRSAQIALGQSILIAACLYLFLQGWRRDLTVPLSFSMDSLLALMQSKSTIDNGWWWFNPMLGAPFGFDELAFPANSNVDQSIVWVVSRFVHDALTAINLAWMLMVVLSGLTATWCMRLLGASVVSAVVAGTLFALSPYALYRNVDHLWMVIYLVPFAGATTLILASRPLPDRRSWKASYGFLLAGCALLGFNYVYYAFFACFLLVVASIVGFWNQGHRRVLVAGGLSVALIASCTLINLGPSLYSWNRHGRPTILRDKVPAESEVYGLKVRHLVSPVFQHTFPLFRRWVEKESAAQFPLETENQISRLGLVATVGFLGLLSLLFAPVLAGPGRNIMLAASQLTLASVLLGTVGGFGSLFSLLITPEIRAYNRIAPFIAFFSLTAIAFALDSLFRTPTRRTIVAVIVLALGLGDQRMAASGMNVQHAAIAAEIPQLRMFVRQLEDRLPVRAMVFQLPLRTYLNDSGVARMQPYDHFKLYLSSRTLRWSYPAFSNIQVHWQQAAATLDPRELPSQLAAEGFAAVVIDRFGYEDNGTEVVDVFLAKLPGDSLITQTGRYVALDIRSLASQATAVPSLSKPPVPATFTMNRCEGNPLINLERIGTVTSPFGPDPQSVDAQAEFKVSGWAVDQFKEMAAGGVDVLLDRVPFPAVYRLERDDVARYFKRTEYRESGFAAAIPAGSIGKGQHTLAVRVVSADRRCYYQSPDRSFVAK